MLTRLKPALLALALAVAVAAPALSAELEAGLSLDHSQFTIGAEAGSAEMSVSRAGIFLWEAVSPRLQLGLQAGPLRVTQKGNPATAGMELTGYHLALSGSARLLSTQRVDLDVLVSAGYQRAEADRADQRTIVAWYQGRAELATSLKFYPLILSGGGFAFFAEGDETASGPLEHTRDFDSTRHGGGFLALDYWVDATGRISLRGEAGGREGIELQFARRF